MRGAISAHSVFLATDCTRQRRWEPASRATTADQRRTSRNCCAAMCTGQRIQRGGTFLRIQKGELGMMGSTRCPLQDPSSPTPCLAGPQHRCITVSIVLNNVTQVPQSSYIALPPSSCIHLHQYLLVLDQSAQMAKRWSHTRRSLHQVNHRQNTLIDPRKLRNENKGFFVYRKILEKIAKKLRIFPFFCFQQTQNSKLVSPQ